MAEKKTISLPLVNVNGESTSKVTLDASVFGIEPNKQVILDAVLVSQANSRQATAKTKKRFEVSGGGKKPWRQKGTGRARAGSIRSPIWVGGGTVFGPTGVQNYKLSQNKQEHKLALKSALSIGVANKNVIVLDELKIAEGKTKEVVKVLTAIKAEGKVLVVVKEADDNLLRASSNIPNVRVVLNNNVSVYDLLNANKAVFTKEAIKAVEEGLK